jgi:hypothetical protein
MFWEFLDKSDRVNDATPLTWDERLGRRIRRFFRIFMGPLAPRGEDPLEDWVRAKNEAWDRREAEARDVLRERRAQRRT